MISYSESILVTSLKASYVEHAPHQGSNLSELPGSLRIILLGVAFRMASLLRVAFLSSALGTLALDLSEICVATIASIQKTEPTSAGSES